MFSMFLQSLKSFSLYLFSVILIIAFIGCSTEEDEGERLSNLVTSTVGPNNSPIVVTTFPIIQTVSGESTVVELAPSVFPITFQVNNNTPQYLFITSLTTSVDFIDANGGFQTRNSVFTVGDLNTPDDPTFLPTTITFPFSDGFGDGTAAINPGMPGSFSGPGNNNVIYISGMPTPEDIGASTFTYNVEVTFRGFFSTTEFTGDVTANFIHTNSLTAKAVE